MKFLFNLSSNAKLISFYFRSLGIFVLSIDIEGIDDKVLMGGQLRLKRLSHVVIEYGVRIEAIDALLR